RTARFRTAFWWSKKERICRPTGRPSGSGPGALALGATLHRRTTAGHDARRPWSGDRESSVAAAPGPRAIGIIVALTREEGPECAAVTPRVWRPRGRGAILEIGRRRPAHAAAALDAWLPWRIIQHG